MSKGDIYWIKLSTNMLSDEKIKLIRSMPDGYEIFYVWIGILTQAGKCNASGYLLLNQNIPYTEQMLSVLFDLPESKIRYALDTLEGFGMIEIEENTFLVSNWEKHQSVDKHEKMKEDTRLRVQKHRENRKLLKLSDESSKCNVTRNGSCNDEVTVRNAQELELEKEINISSNEPSEFSNSVSIENEFETFWTLYPRKEGRKPAFDKYKAKRKTHSFETIIEGTKRYIGFLEKNKTEKQFIQHGKTFLNQEGFLEYNEKPSHPNVIKKVEAFHKSLKDDIIQGGDDW